MLPRRVRPDDVHLPPLPGAPGPRKRRRPRAPPAAPRVRPGERALLLHLPAFGRDLYLQLRHDLRFLSRGFEVEEAGAAGRRGRPAELCFYSGRVLGHPGSLVSLSACGAGGGLVLPVPPPGLRVCLSWRQGWSLGKVGMGVGALRREVQPPGVFSCGLEGTSPLPTLTLQRVSEQRGWERKRLIIQCLLLAVLNL